MIYGKAALHRDRRLPDERAGQRAGGGQPARAGYELVDSPPAAPTRSSSTRAVSGSTPRTKSTAPWAGLKHAKDRHPREDHRRAGLHGPKRPGTDLQAGPARRPGRRARPTAPDSRPARANRRRPRPADGSEPRAAEGRAGRIADELRKLRSRCAIPRCGPTPLSGMRADHDRLRQVLHLLHRPDASAGPNRAARPTRSWPRCGNWPTRDAWRSRCSGQTVNSYASTSRRPDRAAARPSGAIARRSKASRRLQVRDQLSHGT